MIRWRMLVRDYAKHIDISQAMILVPMGGNATTKRSSVIFQSDSQAG